jgi:hypothetical protein
VFVADDPPVDEVDAPVHAVGHGDVVGDGDHAAPASPAMARSTPNTCSELRLSSEPVGSSARITSGSLASARATATRWRCPPESCSGRLST